MVKRIPKDCMLNVQPTYKGALIRLQSEESRRCMGQTNKGQMIVKTTRPVTEQIERYNKNQVFAHLGIRWERKNAMPSL